jgi:hypothetical protein
MNVTQAVRSGTRVELPPAVQRPFEVYVNGIAQQEGVDFTVVEGALLFARELRQEGRLGFWRWTSMIFGAAGTYRQNDVVDVAYELDGRPRLASGLPVAPP